MSSGPNPQELHTEADDMAPLTPREAESMGRQVTTGTVGEKVTDQVVYGDVENSVENQDQYDAHHAESDEHV